MPSNFSLIDAAEITLAPFMAREERREDARRSYHEADAEKSRGVRHSGEGPAPFAPVTREELRHRAALAASHAAAWAQSPRGRFLLAIRELQDLGWGAQAEVARAAFTRGFASPDREACPKEIGVALRAIEPIDHPKARTACCALADLLTFTLKLAAE